MNPPGVEVAVYEVTTDPPFEAGAPKLTVALRLPVVVAITEVGEEDAVVTGATTKFIISTQDEIVPELNENEPSEAIVIVAPLLEVTGTRALIIPVEAV